LTAAAYRAAYRDRDGRRSRHAGSSGADLGSHPTVFSRWPAAAAGGLIGSGYIACELAGAFQ